MSLPLSIPKTTEQDSFENLLTLTRTAVGLGIGILLADKIKESARQATAVALLSIGTLAALPFFVKLALERINRPESERGSQARLRSIRRASDYSHDADIY
jgi:hypothetical protein